ncbi:hypothetical protein GGTG_09236 [Gaeumannomyces tritici R3-111a-1]|uniref:Uncharacterized protein n=1 Tax=Gaeumannomyces tritici (strain R3-111a-1) TaxID=644352 RepID=J3P6U4_GAET3|nr:hypothetical protein GGTG_09236 [Gaeumannomyces tritici R3-111a-1]EJT72370.1 hypothetical protein GGTG_09236 [Gaeumannomyces tritici R3-111a-1]
MSLTEGFPGDLTYNHCTLVPVARYALFAALGWLHRHHQLIAQEATCQYCRSGWAVFHSIRDGPRYMSEQSVLASEASIATRQIREFMPSPRQYISSRLRLAERRHRAHSGHAMGGRRYVDQP